MIEVKKQSGESNSNLLRRFSRRMQESGVLLKARRNRFSSRKATKRVKLQSALFREEIRKEKNKLVRIGLLKRGELLDIKKFKAKKGRKK